MAKTRASGTSTSPAALNSIGVREFLRGGIYDLTVPTTVLRNNTELGTWYPRGQGMTANYYSSTSSLVPDVSTLTGTPMASAMSSHNSTVPQKAPLQVQAAVALLQEYLRQTPSEGEDDNG